MLLRLAFLCSVFTLISADKETFYYKPIDDKSPESHTNHATSLEALFNKDLTPYHMRKRHASTSNLETLLPHQKLYFARHTIVKRQKLASSKSLCLYSDISRKINTCFLTSSDCASILACITESRLIETCGHFEMYTPSVWILDVFETLQARKFCDDAQLGCLSGWGIGRNESLEKLNDIMKSMHKYGTEFLDMKKVNTKVYCAKSLSLVGDVKDVFNEMDQCSFNEVYEGILNAITTSAERILNKECSYCITKNSIFEGCLMDYWGNENNCSTTLACIYQKIERFKCNQDKDETPLTLLSEFLSSISSICELETNKTETMAFVTVEWFRELEYCVQGKQFLGLTFSQAPVDVNVCQSMEETFKCVQQTLHDFRFIQKPLFKTSFALFANKYNRMQRQCDLLSLHREVSTAEKASEASRHSFISNQEQEVFEDNKLYYQQTVIWPTQSQLINWIDIDVPQFGQYFVNNDRDLAENYLKATVVNLKFTFPFYGHLLNRIVVATGGFIYVGSVMNSLITKTQYIAPLMGNFDPTLNKKTAIRYVDNGTHFICNWENIVLKDQPQNGEYTFQVVLNINGDIAFNYKTIPNKLISTSNHEVKIGLSDAYVNYNLVTKSKIEYRIVQYHRINVSLETVRNGNSVMFFMLKNCIQLDSCSACLRGVENFKCMWCPVLQRCSDTLDRYRQEWMASSCPTDNTQPQTCSSAWSTQRIILNPGHKFIQAGREDESEITVRASDYVKAILIGVFSTLMISMLVILSGWFYYAYNHPTSASGIWLIEHRPSKIIPMLAIGFKRDSATGASATNSTRFENEEG